MKFFVDANLPPGLASWLRGFGHDAIHVMDVVGLGQDDRAIFDHGRLHDLIIGTKDEDFAMLMTLSSDPPKVVWLRLGNATNPALRAWQERWVGGIIVNQIYVFMSGLFEPVNEGR